jgi:hypothetical protein
LNLG